jgi:hypothetical protein
MRSVIVAVCRGVSDFAVVGHASPLN